MDSRYLTTAMLATILIFSAMLQSNIILIGTSADKISQVSSIPDPLDDLVYIDTGNPAVEYFEYVDVELVNLELKGDTGELWCTITVPEGPPVVTENTIVYELGFDRNNDPADNCMDHPHEDIDTRYAVTYLSITNEWQSIERYIYDDDWSYEATAADYGLASSFPGGFSISIWIPLAELTELTEILPWRVKTETFTIPITFPALGDFVPDQGLAYFSSGIAFSQVDFVFTDANVPDSDWGHIEVNVAQFTDNLGLDEGYLNVYTDSGWVIQNLFIDRASGMENIVSYFDLGIQSGTDVTSLSAYLEFTTIPYVNFEDGSRSDYPVKTIEYNAEGAGSLQTTAIPTPLPPLVFDPSGETWDFKKPNEAGENVQAANDQCFPMSIANSLQYLENQHGLPVPHDHKLGLKGDDSLVGKLDTACDRGVRTRRDGDGVWFDDMLEGKFKYLSENGLTGRLIHRHQGYGYDDGFGNGALPPGDFTRHGITSKDESVGGMVTFDWIHEQLKKCEDVEVVFTYENDTTGDITGGHAVRVFGCGKVFGIPYIWYKHDRLQTNRDQNDTRGLEEVVVAVLDLDGDGMPNFGSVDQEICFALSESITIEVDNFPESFAKVNIDGPLGTETVTLTGPTTVEVDLSSLADTDGNGREEVETEIVAMDLTGFSEMLGYVTVRLRDPEKSPYQRSLGQIEENINNNPGVLDLPPFTETGTADSFFDVYFEIVAAGQTFHNLVPKRMRTTITCKPPKEGETYVNPVSIPLFDEDDNPTGVVIGATFHTPDPIEVDYFPVSFATVDMETPYGFETVTLEGPTTVEVDFTTLSDWDDDGREEVQMEIVAMQLVGLSDSLGPIIVRLRDPEKSPYQRSYGHIEETTNNNPGVLDLPPFTETGTADSFFDVYFEIDAAGITIHNESPGHIQATITHKPPAEGETYEGHFEIYPVTEQGYPVDVVIRSISHTPLPLPDRIPGDVDGNGVVDIFDVVIVATAFGSEPGDPRWDQAADMNDDNVVDIFDVVIVAQNFGKTAE